MLQADSLSRQRRFGQIGQDSGAIKVQDCDLVSRQLSSSESDLAAAAIKNSSRCLMAVDHYKFEHSAPHRGINPHNIDLLVTDRMPGKELKQALANWEVEIEISIQGQGLGH